LAGLLVEAPEVVDDLLVEPGTTAVVEALTALDEETLLLEDAPEVEDDADAKYARVEEEETAVAAEAARVEDCVGICQTTDFLEIK
jgi:hypothetical protein